MLFSSGRLVLAVVVAMLGAVLPSSVTATVIDQGLFGEPVEFSLDDPVLSAELSTSIATDNPTDVGGVTWVAGPDVFAAALEDRIEFVDERGIYRGIVTGIPDATDPRGYDGHVFVAGPTTNEIIEIDPATQTIVNRWPIDADGPFSVAVTDTEVWFSHGYNSGSLGSINRSTGQVTLDRVVGLAHDNQVRVSNAHPDRVVSLGRSFPYKMQIWSTSVVPAVETAVFDTDESGYLALSADGNTIWFLDSGGQVKHPVELDAASGVPRATVYTESPYWSIEESPNGEFVVTVGRSVGHNNDGIYLFRQGQPAPAFTTWNVGYGSIHSGSFGVSDSAVAVFASISQHGSSRYELQVMRYRPTLFSLTVDDGIERIYESKVEVEGEALDGVTSVTFDGIQTPFVEGGDRGGRPDPTGRWITLDVPNIENVAIGTHVIGVSGPLGSSTLNVEVVAPEPRWVETACPVVTDSISRLFSAYFLRTSDKEGFDFWLSEYQTGRWSLDRMSAFFAESPEFNRRYGDLADAAFIELVYRNVLEREPDPEGGAYWLTQLQTGALNRGRLMLSFSESPEYVTKTNTELPLAGYFNWYPNDTRWQCAGGNAEVSLRPGQKYVDLAFYNPTGQNEGVTLFVVTDDGYSHRQFEEAVEPGRGIVFLAVPLSAEVEGFSIRTSPGLQWTVVDSSTPLPTNRSGWN